MPGCTTMGCERGHYARGLCNTHWKAQRRAAGVDASRSRYAEQRTCDCCGDTYTADRPASLYCSTTCRDLANLSAGQQAAASALGLAARDRACTVTYGACIGCGTLWCGPATGRQRMFCTQSCRRRHRRLNRRRGYRKHADAVHERDGWTCWLCGDPTTRQWTPDDPLAPTLDHIVPRIHGGTDTPDNLGTAHAICNSTRGARTHITTLPPPSLTR